MGMLKVWEILEKFKSSCRLRGWDAIEGEDLIRVGEKYHNFLCARSVHPSSFQRIASNRKCAVREGFSYKIIEASYTAWLFSECPSTRLLKIIFENPELSEHVAIYDLSPLFKGKKSCAKVNMTDSVVFHEFEHFLNEELNIRLKTIKMAYTRQLLDDITV